MEQEKWTSEILNSLDGMQKAEPSPYLFGKIQNKLNTQIVEKIPARWAFVSMVSMVLLLVINISFAKDSEANENEEIIYEQQLINSDQLY